MENKELELLKEFFNNVINNGNYEDYHNLKNKILEIQKQNKLQRKIEDFKLNLYTHQKEQDFNEILKELGYKC